MAADPLSRAADRLADAADRMRDATDRTNPDLEAVMAQVSEAVTRTVSDRVDRTNPLLDEAFGLSPPPPPAPPADKADPQPAAGGRAATTAADPDQLAAVLGQLAAKLDGLGAKGEGGVVDLWHEVVDLSNAPPKGALAPEEPFDPTRAVNAIRAVPGAAANPGAALTGVGDMLSKALGPEAMIVWESGKALAKLGEVAIESARAQERVNFQLANASGLMAAVQARDEVQDVQRDRRVGDRTAGSAEALSDSLNAFDDNTEDIKVLLTNLSNTFLADMLKVLNLIAAPMGVIADAANKYLGEKKPEPTGFGEFLKEAQEEGDKARARAQAAFDRITHRAGRR